MKDLQEIATELSEFMRLRGWKVSLQEDSWFTKSSYEEGIVSVGKYRQGKDQIEVYYQGTFKDLDKSSNTIVRTRLIWDVVKQEMFEMKPGGSRELHHSRVEISEVAAEVARRVLLKRWKEIQAQAKTRLREITEHKSFISKIVPIDLKNVRGRRAGKNFGF